MLGTDHFPLLLPSRPITNISTVFIVIAEKELPGTLFTALDSD